MQIPIGRSGFPTVSPSQLRVYGAGGFEIEEQEQARGCPRQYKAKYVDKEVPDVRSDVLDYGSLIHECLYLMEEESIGPEEALERCFPAHMDPKFWTEALEDLEQYLLRGGPSAQYHTLAVEQRLEAELYVDEEFGPIWIQGIIDHLGVDPEDDGLIHLTDYKTNRAPASAEQARGDSQLKTYNWLVMENWSKYSMTGFPRITTHLDLVKWHEVEIKYSVSDIEAWHSWAVAVVRKILRDDKAEPQLNPGCGWCPVQEKCPAFQELPEVGLNLLLNRPLDPDGEAKWAAEANRVRLLLDNAVKGINEKFKTTALREGEISAGGWRWYREPDWKNTIDLRVLHRAMGDTFYDVAKASKTGIENAIKGWDEHAKKAVRQAIGREADGMKVSKEELDD
jgi:RecB family exonuclease